jgi:hypothetical protein
VHPRCNNCGESIGDTAIARAARSIPVSRAPRHPLVGHDVMVIEVNVPQRPHRILDIAHSDQRGRWELLVLDIESHEIRQVAAQRCQVLPPDVTRRTVVL